MPRINLLPWREAERKRRRQEFIFASVGALLAAGVLTLVAWLLEPGSRGPRQLRAAIFSPTGFIAVFLGCWALLSLIWTPFGTGPSERFVKSASTFVLAAVAAALLPERTRTSNLYLLPIGVAAGAIAIIVLAVFSRSPSVHSGNPEVSLLARAAFGLALLVWPALGALIVRDKPCLLYTSPSPRDRTRSRMPPSA